MGLDDLIRKMLMGDGYHGDYDDSHHYKRYLRYLTSGNLLFLAASLVLLLFYAITGLVDVYNGVPVSKWLGLAWNYVQGIPVSEIGNYAEGEKILTEAAKNITPQDVLSPAQRFISLMTSLLVALLDEIIGVGLLVCAFFLRAMNQYAGRPSTLFSWLLMAASPVAAIVKYL